MTTRGIDVRQKENRIIFRALLQDSAGAIVTTGTTELRVFRLEDDGTLDVYDWTTNNFVAPGSGTPDDETTMTHRQRRDSSGADVNTGIWTNVLSTLTNWADGQVYLIEVNNSNATPAIQVREFQFGNVQGDQTVADKLKAFIQLLARKDSAIGTDRSTELSEINEDEGSGSGSYAQDSDSHEAIRDTAPLGTAMRGTDGALTDKTGFSLSAAGILAIWHQLTSGIITSSTIGKLLVDNINATISSRSSFDASTDTVDVGKINGNADAARKLGKSADTILEVTAIAGTLSTTQMSVSGLTETQNDKLIGRVIIWLDGDLQRHATDITDTDLGATDVLTFTAVPVAPSVGDTAIIV